MNMNTRILHAGQAYDIEAAGEILRRGGLVAIPTETVYGLAGNALDPAVSARIYAVKGRPSDNPLIVHISAMEELLQVAVGDLKIFFQIFCFNQRAHFVPSLLNRWQQMRCPPST